MYESVHSPLFSIYNQIKEPTFLLNQSTSQRNSHLRRFGAIYFFSATLKGKLSVLQYHNLVMQIIMLNVCKWS